MIMSRINNAIDWATKNGLTMTKVELSHKSTELLQQELESIGITLGDFDSLSLYGVKAIASSGNLPPHLPLLRFHYANQLEIPQDGN